MASPRGSNKAKKQKTDESISESDLSKSFNIETQKTLEEIDACQNQIDELNEKVSEEILNVEKKYNKHRRPFYEKRSEAISKIKGFWLTTITNHPAVSAIISLEDEEALQHLQKLEVEESDDIKSGYKIKFHFATNPYFANDMLVKEFTLSNAENPSSQSTRIQWKEKQNLIEQAQKRRASENGKKKGRESMSQSETTFFEWFMNNKSPMDDEIAEVIKDELWPNPLHYFLGSDYDTTMDETAEDDEDPDESADVTHGDGDEDEEGDDDEDDDNDDDDEDGEDA